MNNRNQQTARVTAPAEATHATSGVCHGLANHRPSARRGIAKAQKVFPAALRCAVSASRKPGVSFPGHPSNACV
jgi:hypothetical protein